MRDQALWARLLLFDFRMTRGGHRLSALMVARLGLSEQQAGVTLAEYRRYLYLTAVSDAVLAPSPLIADVRRLHLEGGETSLGDLSTVLADGAVLPPPDPSASQHDAAYDRTLALYREEFQEPPFAKVWPSRTAMARERWAVAGFAGGVVMAVGGLVLGGGSLLALSPGLATMLGSIGLWKALGPWAVNRNRDGDSIYGAGGSIDGADDSGDAGDGGGSD